MKTNETLRISRLGCAALAVLFFGSAVGQTGSTRYAVELVGFADTNQLPSLGIDSTGRVAGQCLYVEDGQSLMRAWTYQSANGYLLSPSEYSTINGVSSNGLLVGSSYGSPTVFDWLGNPTTVFPTTSGCFMAANRYHEVAGFVFDPKEGWAQTAVLYDVNGNWVKLEGPEIMSSAAYGINDFGGVVGYACTINGECRAFYWYGGMEFLPGLTGNSDVATGINNRYVVVGYTVTPTDQVLPVSWSVGPSFSRQVPIDLPLGYTNGFAQAVNDNGQVVGTMWGNGTTESHAFVTMSDGRAVDLNSLKTAGGRNFNLLSANAINARGMITGMAKVKIYAGGEPPRTMAYVAKPITSAIGRKN